MSHEQMTSHDFNGAYGPLVYGNEMASGAMKFVFHEARPYFIDAEPTAKSGVRLGHVIFARDLLAHRHDVLKELLENPPKEFEKRITPKEKHELNTRKYDLEDLNNYLTSREVAPQVALLEYQAAQEQNAKIGQAQTSEPVSLETEDRHLELVA